MAGIAKNQSVLGIISGNILINLDTEANPHLLYRLFQENYALQYKFNQSKSVKNWKTKLGIDYYHTSAIGVIEHFLEKDKLTKESFIELEKFARKQIRITNRSMYTFKVNLNDKYTEILKNLK